MNPFSVFSFFPSAKIFCTAIAAVLCPAFQCLHADTIFIASGSSSITKYNANGTYTTFVTTGLNAPYGMVFDPNGNLFVANIGNGTLSKITSNGTVSLFASGLNAPTGVALDKSGNFYVANAGNGTISKVSASGVVSTFATGLDRPCGLALDGGGNLYVANSNTGTILKLTATGVASTFASDCPGVIGLAFDSVGNLYASISRQFWGAYDTEVVKITPSGVMSTLATIAIPSPEGIALDSLGNIYVAEYNGTISKVTSTGQVSTFASNGDGTTYIAIQSIPEPTTWALMILGCILLWWGSAKHKHS